MSSERVVSPHVVIQVSDGVIFVYSAETDQTYSTEDPAVLALLGLFVKPNDTAPVIAGSADPGAARQHVMRLEEIGALYRPCERGRTLDEPPPGQLVERFLSPIAESLDSLAGALAGIGPEVGLSIRSDTGLGLEARLLASLSGLIAIQQVVATRIPDWISGQLERIELPSSGLNVHVGAGSANLKGWLNIDLWPAQVAMDFRWGLPFRDGSADRVYLSHVLEHAYYPAEAIQLLRESFRVLGPGGRIRIVVPDIEASIAAYVSNDVNFFKGRNERWPGWKIRTRMESFLGFAGVGPQAGLFGDAHKWGYDLETMIHILSEAGFREIGRSTYQGSPDPELRVDDQSAWAGAKVGEQHYSLFVEAVR